MFNSYEKTLKQISSVALAPFVVDGVVYKIPTEISVGPSFWRSYVCSLGCGGCCRYRFSLDFVPFEREKFVEMYPQHASIIEKRTINVNGNDREIHSIMPPDGKEECLFLDMPTGLCLVHEATSFSCRVELIKFRWYGDKAHIQKSIYSRAHQMKRSMDNGFVKCDTLKFDEKQFWENDIPVFETMKRWADYMGIDTHLPGIIEGMKYCVNTGQFLRIIFENQDWGVQ